MRKLALAAAMVVWLFPLQGNALGLGEINAKSYLNQKLNAELSLHSLRAGDLEELEVRMADQRDYQRAQIPWQEWMGKVKFSVERNAKGVAFVRMTTKEAIREPFLNFLVKAVWANGRVLKQYTLLIDPERATVPTDNVTPLEAADTSESREEDKVETEQRTSTTPPPIEPIRQTERVEPVRPRVNTPPPPVSDFGSDEAESTYRVKRGDYAWRLARERANQINQRTGQNVSIQQVLMALLEANPDAFVNNNANRMKSGVVVKLPGNVSSWSKQDAINELAKQNASWRQYQQVVAQGASDVAVSTSGQSGLVDNEEAADAVVPEVPTDNPSFEVLSADKQASIKNKLKLANEGISTKIEEQRELKAKVAKVEDQVKNLDSLIDVQMQKLAALGSQKPKERTLADIQNDAAAATADEPQIATSSNPVEQPDDLEIIDEPEETSGFMSMLNNPKVVGLLVGVILVFAALIWIVRRRSMNLDEFQESILTNAGANTNSELTQTLSGGGGMASNSSMMGDFATSGLTSGIQSEVNVMDPLAEADVYLAYGRFQHAEELMKEAISKEPARLEFKGKLLEIYSAMKEKQGFVAVANELYQATGGKGPLWEKAHSMGRALCPESPLFGGQASNQPPAESGADHLRVDETMVLGDTSQASEDTRSFSSHEVPSLDETMQFNLNASMDQTTDFNLNSGAVEDTNIIDFDLDRKVSSPETLDETTIIRPNDSNNMDFNQFQQQGATASAGGDDFFNFQTLSEGDHELPPLDSTQIIQPGGGGGGGNGSSSVFDEDMDEATLFSDIDEVGTKLDLARAYIDMGDPDGARSILGEVIEEGNNNQKQEANELLSNLG